MVQPTMPAEVKQRGLHGEYSLRVTVGGDGTVEEAVVERSTHPIVNDAVIAAAKQCRFRVPSAARGTTFKLFWAGMY